MSRRPSLTWTQLELPVHLSHASARAALVSLATLAGNPRIVLEASGSNGSIAWRLGCDASIHPRVLAALSPHLVALRSAPLPANDELRTVEQAAKISFRGPTEIPLRLGAAEPVTRGLLGALSSAKKSEAVHVQLILGPTYRPSHPRTPHKPTRRDELKVGEYRFGCAIRISARAGHPARVRTLITGAASALRGLEVPGIRVSLTRTSTTAFSDAKTPWIWPDQLSVDDLVPLLAWPIGEPPLPGVIAAHPKVLPPAPSLPDAGRVLGLATAARSERPVALKQSDSQRHLWIIGPTGVGKSTVMGHLALADLEAGLGGLLIDPKGDLADDVLQRVPSHRRDDVVVLDATDRTPVGIAALAGQPDLAADTVLGTFHSLYADAWGPRTHDILHACLLTLARRGDASLLLIPALLTHAGFRRSVVGQVVKADPLGLGSFWAWYDGISEAERQTAIAPLMNKLRPILLRPGLRGILGQRHPKFCFNDIFTKRKFLVVNLSKGTLGPEASQLLGSLVVSLTWMAALRRTAAPRDKRSPVAVYIDELQDYLRLPGDVGDALAQARGLGVSFTLAHQHLGQLSPTIRTAISANARSRVAFALSPNDARDFAKTTAGELTPEDFQSLPAFRAYASLLVDGSTAPWCSLTTLPLTASRQHSSVVRERSRELYGQPLDQVEADLLATTQMVSPLGHDAIGRAAKEMPHD